MKGARYESPSQPALLCARGSVFIPDTYGSYQSYCHTAPAPRKTVATVTKIRLRSAEDSRHAGPFSGKQKRKKNMAYVTYSVDGRSYFSQREIPVSADKDIGSQVTVWYAVLFPDTLIDPPFLCKARPLYPAVPADVSCRFLTVAVN